MNRLSLLYFWRKCGRPRIIFGCRTLYISFRYRTEDLAVKTMETWLLFMAAGLIVGYILYIYKCYLFREKHMEPLVLEKTINVHDPTPSLYLAFPDDHDEKVWYQMKMIIVAPVSTQIAS